jgi:hypothetical protein
MEWTTFQLLKAIKLLQENWELNFVLEDDYGSAWPISFALLIQQRILWSNWSFSRGANHHCTSHEKLASQRQWELYYISTRTNLFSIVINIGTSLIAMELRIKPDF